MFNNRDNTAPFLNRLKVSLPKIGIRPVIDGRRKGVRESLEKQTMLMAQNAENFLVKISVIPTGLT